jgi:hypothetical protein
MDAETMLTTTRSVRRKLDLDRPVEDEVLTDCLRIAMQAPAAGVVMQGIRWIVIREPGLKAAVAGHAREPGLASQARFGDRVSPATLASGRHLLDVLHGVPVLVLLPVAYTTTTSFRPAARPSVEDITYYERWGQSRSTHPSSGGLTL